MAMQLYAGPHYDDNVAACNPMQATSRVAPNHDNDPAACNPDHDATQPLRVYSLTTMTTTILLSLGHACNHDHDEDTSDDGGGGSDGDHNHDDDASPDTLHWHVRPRCRCRRCQDTNVNNVD